MGESNCTWKRKFNLHPDLLISTQAIYKGYQTKPNININNKNLINFLIWFSNLEMYGNEDSSLPATYQVLYFIAWKPDASQVS